MRHYPVFTTKEIEYILDLVMKSDTELFDPGYGIAVKSFTPFKNDLANRLNAYKNVIRERNYHIGEHNKKVSNTGEGQSMTIEKMFEMAPKSERTLIKHGYSCYGFHFLNDMGHPSEYRVEALKGKAIGVIKYYRGRLLSCYGLKPQEAR